MTRDKSSRYASAAALADDLRRHLDEQPILARAPSTLYLVRKFARRHRGKLPLDQSLQDLGRLPGVDAGVAGADDLGAHGSFDVEMPL